MARTKATVAKAATTTAPAGVTKTVMEWLYEMKLYAQKIDKCKDDLQKTPLYYATSEILKDANKEEETITRAQALMTKYRDLTNNYEIIKQAILEFNATTKIEVAGKTYSIARALELYKKDKNYEFLVQYFASQQNKLESDRAVLVRTQSNEVSQLESKLLSGLAANKNDSKIQAQLDTRRAEYAPHIIEALTIATNYQEIRDEHVEFVNQVNAQINIANVTNKLTITLS